MADKTYWLGELVGNKRVGGIKVDGRLRTSNRKIFGLFWDDNASV